MAMSALRLLERLRERSLLKISLGLLGLLGLLALISLISGCEPQTSGLPGGSAQREIRLPVVAEEQSDTMISTQCLMFDREGALWSTSGDAHRSLLVRLTRGDEMDAARPESALVESTFVESVVIEGLFAEGCVEYGDSIMVLTWRDRVALLFDRETLTLSETLSLPHEGWGVTRAALSSAPRELERSSEVSEASDVYVYSDGSSALRWFDPRRSVAERAISAELTTYVRDQDDRPVYQLNELECFGDHLLANHYPSDRVAVIDPISSRVVLWLNLSTLRAREPLESRELNGIAYEPASDLVWFTGKGWSRRYAVDAQVLRARLE